MPFLAPLIGPIIGALGGTTGAIAAGAAGLGGGLLGSKLRGGQTTSSSGLPAGYEQQALANLLRSSNAAYGLVDKYVPGMIQTGQAASQGLLKYGTGLLGQAATNYAPVTDYYKGLLSWDRPTVMQTLSPELGQIDTGYNQLRTAGSELARRGGGTTAAMSELPYQKMGDINKLVFGARPGAAQGLAEVAGAQGQLGLGAAGASRDFLNASVNALGAGTQGLYASTAPSGSLLNYNLGLLSNALQKRQQNLGMYEDLGSGIFSLLKMLGIGGKP